MRILIIGSGGREHALAWKCAQSTMATKIFVAPGNPGTALESKVENVSLDVLDIPGLLAFAKTQDIGLTLVGPEAPLAKGIVDTFTQARLPCLGPTQAAAQLETSKDFCKRFLMRHQIPTAAYASFTDKVTAMAYLKQKTFPQVIKADGLAAGKGVIIAQSFADASAAVEDMLGGSAFGEAGKKIVVEDFLTGDEISFIALCHGEQVLPLATSQDHKARDEGDKGPNTGGMGAYSPAPNVSAALHEKIMAHIIHPTLKGMQAEGNLYTGFLYAGLMITADGEPNVLEFNCRFGDPETQPILMRLQSDFVALCLAAVEKNLASYSIQWDKRAALGVVLAAGGYPFAYERGHEIQGIKDISAPDVKVFHAGTSLSNNKLYTHGGRVLCVTALGDSIKTAQQKAYDNAAKITWDGCYFRRDIGHRALR